MNFRSIEGVPSLRSSVALAGWLENRKGFWLSLANG